MLLATSCASRPKLPEAPPTPPAFTPEQFKAGRLFDYLSWRHDQIRTLKGEVNIRFGHSESELTSSTDAVLAYQAPDRLYLRGYNTYIPQVFTLMVNGNRFWFYVPKAATVITGTKDGLLTRKDIELELNGFGILAGLVSKPLAGRFDFEDTKVADDYVINEYAPGGERDSRRITRTLWMSALSLDVERELHYTAESIQEFEITRSQFFATRGFRLPKFIGINRFREQKSLVLMLWNAEVNVPIAKDQFEFPATPEGVHVEDVS